jgi:hypothetical protein
MTWEENKQRVEDEYAWFNANRAAVIEGHHGEEAVIRDHRVWGYFSTSDDAEAFMDAQGVEYGGYAIQSCLTDQEESDRYYCTYMDIRPAYA